MRKLILSLFFILICISNCFAQAGFINPEQIANKVEITATAGNNLTAGDVVKIINDGGLKAFKYITALTTSFVLDAPSYFSTGGVNTQGGIASTQFSNTSFVVVYSDGADGDKGKAVFGEVSNGSISFSTPVYLVSGGEVNTQFDIVKMNASQILVGYRQSTGAMGGVVGTVSGSSISFGSPVSVGGGGNNNDRQPKLARVNDTTAIIVYYDAYYFYARKAFATISGTSIAWSKQGYLVSGGGDNRYFSVSTLSETRAIIVYSAQFPGNKGVVALYDTATLDSITGVYIESGGVFSGELVVSCPTSSSLIVVYYNNAAKGRVAVGTVSGNTITMGTPVFLTTSEIMAQGFSLAKLTDATYALAFLNTSDSTKGTVALVTITGTTPSVSAHTVFSGMLSNTTSWISVRSLTSDGIVLTYGDQADSHKGKSLSGAATAPPTYSNILPAMANTNITKAESGKFTLLQPFTKITNSGLSLTGGLPYFINATTSILQTTPTNYYTGYALDTTSIYIDGTYFTNTVGQTAGNSTLPVSLIRK